MAFFLPPRELLGGGRSEVSIDPRPPALGCQGWAVAATLRPCSVTDVDSNCAGVTVIWPDIPLVNP